MALSTYAQLQASVADWIDRDDLEVQIRDFIALAEAEFNRTLFIPEREQISTSTLNGATIAVPVDYWGMKALYLETDPRVILEQVALADIRALPMTSGKPEKFALQGTEILFGPAPDSTYAVVMTYWQTIPPLSDAQPTNWLLAAYPDLYLYNALLKGSAFAIDKEQVGTWQGLLSIAFGQAQRTGQDKMAGGAPLRILRAPQVV